MSYLKSLCMIFIFLIGLPIGSGAASLVDIYNQALLNDMVFKQAEATYMSQRETTQAAWAALLPHVSLSGAYTPYHYAYPKAAHGKTFYTTYRYGLNVTQPVFYWAGWKGLKAANHAVKAAEATYLRASQDMMFRVIESYFTVLQRAEVMSYLLAYKKTIYQDYKTQQAKYKAGLVAITDLYNARSSYDEAVARIASARVSLSEAIESLRVISGSRYKTLDVVEGAVPLIAPTPNRVDQWVSQGIKNNYAIKAAEYTELAHLEKISVGEGGHWPTVNLVGQYSQTYVPSSSRLYASPHASGSAGLSLSWNIYDGGAISSQVRKDHSAYISASAAVQQAKRVVTQRVRNAFLGVVGGITKVKANRALVASSQENYKATKASYRVGSRTQVDVLAALSELHKARAAYAQEQYDYIVHIFALKSAVGTLSVDDIKSISTWLTRQVQLTSDQDGIYKAHFMPRPKSNRKKERNIFSRGG